MRALAGSAACVFRENIDLRAPRAGGGTVSAFWGRGGRPLPWLATIQSFRHTDCAATRTRTQPSICPLTRGDLYCPEKNKHLECLNTDGGDHASPSLRCIFIRSAVYASSMWDLSHVARRNAETHEIKDSLVGQENNRVLEPTQLRLKTLS
jgi:hypothetical protein